MAELTTIGITPVGLEVIERIDAERAIRQREIEEAEAVLSEWTAKFSADSALDFYNRIVDVVHGRVAKAQGVADINAVLHDTLLGVWLGFDGRTMTADIKVRPSGLDEYDAAVADLFGTLGPWREAIEMLERLLPEPTVSRPQTLIEVIPRLVWPSWRWMTVSGTPTSRRRPHLPRRTSSAPRRRSRSGSLSASASWMRRPARHSTTMRAQTPPAAATSRRPHDGDDVLDSRRVRRVAQPLVAWRATDVEPRAWLPVTDVDQHDQAAVLTWPLLGSCESQGSARIAAAHRHSDGGQVSAPHPCDQSGGGCSTSANTGPMPSVLVTAACLGSCVGSAYMGGQPCAMASGRSS